MAYLKKYTSGGDYWQKINLLFNSLVVLPLTLFAVTYLEVDGGGSGEVTGTLAKVLEVGSIVLCGALVAWGWQRHRARLRKVEGSFRQRLDAYLASVLRFYFMLFIGCLLLPPVMYLTGNIFFAVIFMVPFALFSSLRPTWRRIRLGAKLDREEWETLRLKKDVPED